MFRVFLNWLDRREGGNSTERESESAASEAGADESGFTPSQLDASVLEAHGMGTSAAERELESIEEKAESLESSRPDGYQHDDER
jgi:hypothetical protein